MVECSRCNGTGWQEYEEDGMEVVDACYHCGNTGIVDEETAFHDKLAKVGQAMAIEYVREYKMSADSDPYGEGFAFHAAERMLTPWEYEVMVYENTDRFCDMLSQLSLSEQEEYIRKYDSGETIYPLS